MVELEPCRYEIYVCSSHICIEVVDDAEKSADESSLLRMIREASGDSTAGDRSHPFVYIYDIY